ncbi:16S rRNA (cytosine(1402)-N(4))-methyltransferase RsmH [Tuwongella immobilis]|uniref:Ribosomal RNA small subunit methyltransferase H n=1 Tax=Tuwongella immobilis TaxID=692036 RepID=A0A6C2YRM2_9BACT|nr:16S rRNA (cytosine(1402)-N(4))-methyltransferase RsmH [Tuwongella immobilis]VIP03635.1 16s rrna methyltransferase : Ribosomal RNA small subunit methyltransferase H OS=Pedosphaera parvula (strain Ellin514) GN=rsmH PE=3 SV=1: Methyltransf_5 [Tuwongella immobilis]VTS04638.1 16s rrna methyltransferase : Ribosomal RNA small subunit methyltransferase H OS=Pedosphaera parvula (strain Ellin514) GN=rsmH PE=3 SV=1: Methyltransf_5 [Tuwongella immobilis]
MKPRRPYRRPRPGNAPRSTPQGEHVPVMLAEVLSALGELNAKTVVDCTLGYAGHSSELLRRVGPTGKLVAFDFDPQNIAAAETRLSTIGHPFSLHHGNYAGLVQALAGEEIFQIDGVLADLGMSSMQVDDPQRGFSFMREGPLDMRMDPTRGKTAGELLATIPLDELTTALTELGDEPQAEKIARAIVNERKSRSFQTTTELREFILQAAPVKLEFQAAKRPVPEWQQRIRPVARVFQTLRILVNRELANLTALLRAMPGLLKPGGRIVLISFHSGEDRIIKQAFRDGQRAGVYSTISEEPIRPGHAERFSNPRSRSAKLRWAERAMA